jgi:bacteriocin biosynthesis cyclodehydratase domain-containing protein
VDFNLRLRALPVQVIERANGIILKRGCTEFKVDGPEAEKIVQAILVAVSAEGATLEEVCSFFPQPYRSAVEDLTKQLVARRILVLADDPPHDLPEPEDALDVFYWNFGYRAGEVTENLNSGRISIVGVNCISRQLAVSLRAAKVSNFEVVDYPLLRNLRLFDGDGQVIAGEWKPTGSMPIKYEDWSPERDSVPLGCLVATSDFGGMHLLREWNEYCVKESRHFLPVVLQNVIGYVGPIVVPGETACYECLRARQNSHMVDPDAERAAEQKAFEGQLVNGYHPSMASVLGDIVAMELTKFCSLIPRWRVGTLIEVNLLIPSVVTRKVLKIPRCSVCGSLKKRSAVTTERLTYQAPKDYVAVK